VTLIERMRGPLFVERSCPECGRLFKTRNLNMVYCSRRHYMRAWRAAKMLEGTHGYVDGQFARVSA
jgi:hypothetical protein